jgi:ligand-binding sensor domain-containing protein
LRRDDERVYTLARRDGLPKNETTALAVRNDSVWVGTYRGLALYTPSVDTLVVVSRDLFGDLFITDLLLAGSRLIIGSTTGAFYIDLVSREVGRLRDPEGDLGGEIRHLAAFGNEILVSTDYGVTVIDTVTGASRPLPYIDAATGAYAAAANKTYYAIAVADGLTLINRRRNDRRHHLTRDDGLLSEKINAMESDGEYLWLGSEEGLTRFQWKHPDRID